jgi:hypothetical protein
MAWAQHMVVEPARGDPRAMDRAHVPFFDAG